MKIEKIEIVFSASDLTKGLVLPNEITEDLAEETGLHIGDGSMNFYNGKGLYQLRGHIKDDRSHYFNRISELYMNLYNIKTNIRNMESSGVLGFQIWTDAIVQFKHYVLGLPLGKKTDFSLPFFTKDRDLFFAFMRGLFDTDGTLYIENKRGKPYPRVEIKTTAKTLSSQIVGYMNKFGFNTHLYHFKRREKGWSDIYTISLRGFNEVSKWFDTIGSNNPKHKEKWEKLNGPAVI